MRHSRRRIASEIARQQLEELLAQIACAGTDTPVDDTTPSLADLLVMGDDRLPYLVRRYVEHRAGGASRLYGVSVAAADSRRPGRPVIRTVVALEPRTVLNGPGPRVGAMLWNDIDRTR